MPARSMMHSEQIPWKRWGQYLYKFRKLGSHATNMIVEPHLYFAAIKEMSDRTEVGAEIVVDSNSQAVEKHLQDYRNEIVNIINFERRLFNKAMLKYYEDPFASFQVSRRNLRLQAYLEKLAYADKLLLKLRDLDNREASYLLKSFYESIRVHLPHASVCCLTNSVNIPKMWDEYAHGHRGICFEFSDKIYIKEKNISRSNVIYTEDGNLHPLEVGYLKAYESLYSTKHVSYAHEQEIRFFIFGDPRKIKIRSPELYSVIIGSDVLNNIMKCNKNEQMRKDLKDLCLALEKRNSMRNPEHKTQLYIASWKGYNLYTNIVKPSDLVNSIATSD